MWQQLFSLLTHFETSKVSSSLVTASPVLLFSLDLFHFLSFEHEQPVLMFLFLSNFFCVTESSHCAEINEYILQTHSVKRREIHPPDVVEPLPPSNPYICLFPLIFYKSFKSAS